MYKKVTMYYFTGTGNSYRFASWMGETASARGIISDVIPIENARPAEESGTHVSVTPTRVGTRIIAYWPGAVINYAYFLLSVYLTYSLFNRLVRFKWINKLFTYTTLTHYYRRYTEPGTRLKHLGKD